MNRNILNRSGEEFYGFSKPGRDARNPASVSVSLVDMGMFGEARQRTVEEYKHLFDPARFALTRVLPRAGSSASPKRSLFRRQFGSPMLDVGRKENIEDRSTLSDAGITPDANRASMFLNDSAADPESEPGPVFSFRRKKRLEYSFAIFRSNARSRVGNNNA